ncbi:MAG: hypothetical protein ACE5NC_08615, partial [Anaerolineae bacterium]
RPGRRGIRRALFSWPRTVLSRQPATVLVASVTALALTSLPYAFGSLMPTDGLEFGGVLMNVEDSQSYLAKMRQGMEGHLLYQIPYSSEPHSGAFIGGFYLLWGWLARALGGSLGFWWQAARIASALALMVAMYAFVAAHLEGSRRKLLAYLLALFGSGLGWLILPLGGPWFLGSQPTDLNVPEAHPFFILMAFPHFSAALAGSLLAVLLLQRTLVSPRPRFWVGASLAASVTALALPYWALLIVAGAAAALLAARLRGDPLRGVWSRLGLLAVLPGAILLYQILAVAADPATQAWFFQAVTLSPHPLHFLLAFLPLFILALPGAANAWRERDRRLILLLWVALLLPLLYLPLNPQRRLVAGLHRPLSVLAAEGALAYWIPRLMESRVVTALMQRWPQRYQSEGIRGFALVGIVAITVPSNLYLIAGYALRFSDAPFPFFREQEVVAAEAWLDDHASFDDSVLTTYWTGTFLPAQAGVRVYLGHWAETALYEEKREKVAAFFDEATDDQWRVDLLAEHGIRYLFYGPREAAIEAFDPEGAGYLVPAYRNDMVTIYRVVSG